MGGVILIIVVVFVSVMVRKVAAYRHHFGLGDFQVHHSRSSPLLNIQDGDSHKTSPYSLQENRGKTSRKVQTSEKNYRADTRSWGRFWYR